jgi:hypothetical protein
LPPGSLAGPRTFAQGWPMGRTRYEYQEFFYLGEYGENGFVED